MKKLISICLVLSFILVGSAFANDEISPRVIKGTDQYTPYQQERNPSIKALVGSEQVPIVDNTDVWDPNFSGERSNVTPQMQQKRSYGVIGVNTPVVTSSPKTPSSP